MRISLIILLVAGLFVAVPHAIGHAQSAGGAPANDRATARGRTELRLSGRYILRTTADYTENRPSTYLALAGGYFLHNNLRVAVNLGYEVGGDRSSGSELLFEATGLVRVPLVRLFATAAAGGYATEYRGGDFIDNDGGLRLAGELGLQFAVPRSSTSEVFIEPAFSISGSASTSRHGSSNSFGPPWNFELSARLAVPISL